MAPLTPYGSTAPGIAQQEFVAPEHGTGLSGIEQTADVRKGLRLIQLSEHRVDLSRSVVWMGLKHLCRNSEIAIPL